MTVKQLKDILNTFNEDLEVKIGGVFEDEAFRINEVRLGKMRLWKHTKTDPGNSISYDVDIVRLESDDVHTMEEDAQGEDI